MESHPIIKFIVIALLVLIVGALGRALFTLFRGRDSGTAGVKALTLRVGLSITLFVFLMLMYALGFIEPRSG